MSALKARHLNSPEADRRMVRLKILEIVKIWIDNFWENFVQEGKFLIPECC
jgi:hypothetical protein